MHYGSVGTKFNSMPCLEYKTFMAISFYFNSQRAVGTRNSQNISHVEHVTRTTEPGCTTTSQPIYCQGVAESPPVSSNSAHNTSQISWLTTSAVQPTFWDSDSFNFRYHGRQLAPNS